jgi:hypothetical protein
LKAVGRGRELRRAPCRAGVLGGDLGRRAQCEPVIDLPCAIGDPPHAGPAELDLTVRRVVPEESVSATRDEEWNRAFRVAPVEVDNDALPIEETVPAPAETEQLLARVPHRLLGERLLAARRP